MILQGDPAVESLVYVDLEQRYCRVRTLNMAVERKSSGGLRVGFQEAAFIREKLENARVQFLNTVHGHAAKLPQNLKRGSQKRKVSCIRLWRRVLLSPPYQQYAVWQCVCVCVFVRVRALCKPPCEGGATPCACGWVCLRSCTGWICVPEAPEQIRRLPPAPASLLPPSRLPLPAP